MQFIINLLFCIYCIKVVVGLYGQTLIKKEYRDTVKRLIKELIDDAKDVNWLCYAITVLAVAVFDILINDLSVLIVIISVVIDDGVTEYNNMIKEYLDKYLDN